jgi:hypothetical protein
MPARFFFGKRRIDFASNSYRTYFYRFFSSPCFRPTLFYMCILVKIRAVAAGKDIVRDDFFIIMDCLQCTLDQKLWSEWPRAQKEHGGKFCGLIGRNKETMKSLLVTRMTVAYDLARAFSYMHDHQLVYRDIKVKHFFFVRP